jgi:hypothetical protein
VTSISTGNYGTVPAPTTTQGQPSNHTPDGIATAERWANAAVHTVHLPTGTRVRLRMPNLTEMIRNDAIPERLREFALREIITGSPLETEQREDGRVVPKIKWEDVKEVSEMYLHIVSAMLVEPAMSPDELRRVPAEDFDMLREFATRDRDRDARNVSLGVEPISRWEEFQREHRCPPDCPSCKAALATLSTRSVDDL